MSRFAIRLYITGTSIHSQRAVANLERLRHEILHDDCDLTIVDVLANPEQAEADRVLATPTLICLHPPPARRVIGDLSDLTTLLTALGLQRQDYESKS